MCLINRNQQKLNFIFKRVLRRYVAILNSIYAMYIKLKQIMKIRLFENMKKETSLKQDISQRFKICKISTL